MPTPFRNLPPQANGQMGGGTFNPLRGGTSASLRGGAGFNPLAAGDKSYGLAGRTAPNVGPVRNMGGYATRDIKLEAQKNALDAISKGLR